MSYDDDDDDEEYFIRNMLPAELHTPGWDRRLQTIKAKREARRRAQWMPAELMVRPEPQQTEPRKAPTPVKRDPERERMRRLQEEREEREHMKRQEEYHEARAEQWRMLERERLDRELEICRREAREREIREHARIKREEEMREIARQERELRERETQERELRAREKREEMKRAAYRAGKRVFYAMVATSATSLLVGTVSIKSLWA